MGNAKKDSGARPAPRHRTSTGRHRQPAPTVTELTDLPATAGAKIAVAGVVGTSAALATPLIGLAGQADASVAHTATAQPGTIGGPSPSGNIVIPPFSPTVPAPAPAPAPAPFQAPHPPSSQFQAAAPGQPIAGPARVTQPSGQSYVVPANPGNVFSVPVGTTLTFPDSSTFTLGQLGPQDTVYGKITVLPADQAPAGGSGIPVLTPSSGNLSLPPGAGNSFIVPPDSLVGPSITRLGQGMAVQRGDGVTVTAQPSPAMETAVLPSGAVVPLGEGFQYVLPPGSFISSQDNIQTNPPPAGAGPMRTPSGITVRTGPDGLPGSVTIPAPVDPLPPPRPPGNLSDAGSGISQDGSQQPVLASNIRVPPVSPIQPINPAPRTGGQPGGGSNGQSGTPGQSEFERILNEIKQLQNQLSQLENNQRAANSGQRGQPSGGSGQQGQQQDPNQQHQQDPNQQHQQDPNQQQTDPNQQQTDPNQQTDPSQQQTDPNQQNQFTNPGDPTSQDPRNTQVASSSSSQSRSASSLSRQSTQLAGAGGASISSG